MFKRTWVSTDLVNKEQVLQMCQLFAECKAVYGAFDTETTGLHIILDRPFIYQFGFLDPRNPIGYTFLVDLERQPEFGRYVIQTWQNLATVLQLYLGHNITFDLHMMKNIGLPYQVENMSDTMFYIRYAHDALTPDNGGPPLALKDYASRYVDPKAKLHEKLLDQQKTAIAKDLNIKLKNRLAGCGTPPEKYGAKSYTLKVIEEIFSDCIFEIDDLQPQLKEAYLTWLNTDVPEMLRPRVQGIVKSKNIPYPMLDRKTLYQYAHMDIVLTLETFELTAPVVTARDNEAGLQMENSLILPILDMEEVGFKADREYLLESKQKVKQYLQERRASFYNLCGTELKIGQHEKILELLQGKFGVNVSSTNADVLDLCKGELLRNNPEHPAIEFIDILQELRTLEKWYSTYIMRFHSDLQRTDRLYTQINTVGTVSGRVTSDFQQFPKSAIKTYQDEELFHPRKLVVPTGGQYDALVYLDYSQIELRFQAFYTILVGHPDLNLCRAYMPYKCTDEGGVKFDYNNPEHIQTALSKDWFLDEDPGQKWVPTDVHAKTTEAATGLHPDHPDFHKLRSTIGKVVNFAKNYGAQRGRIRQMFPFKTEEEITRIDSAYYIAFPGVKEYHTYCYDRAQQFSNTANLFGIKYYGVSGHKLINLLVQGSAAFYLKWKIRQIYEYSKAHKIRSRLQMNIHDELSWERHRSELNVFLIFKQIMENWPDTLVPIIAEMAATKINWAVKEEVKDINELQTHLGN